MRRPHPCITHGHPRCQQGRQGGFYPFARSLPLPQPCLRMIRAKGSSQPCVSFPFTISTLAGFPEVLEREPVPRYPASLRGSEQTHGEGRARQEHTRDFPQPPLPGSPRGFPSSSPSSLAWSPLSSLHPQHRGPKVPYRGIISSFLRLELAPSVEQPQIFGWGRTPDSPSPAASPGGQGSAPRPAQVNSKQGRLLPN